MKTMIERVAEAIFSEPLGNMDEIDQADHPRLLAIARAAIAAMREPTGEVQAALMETGILEGGHAGAGLGCWEAGIDAAMGNADVVAVRVVGSSMEAPDAD